MNTLKYIISFCLIGLSTVSLAQDSIQRSFPQRYGLRLGADIYSFAKTAYDKNYRGFELHGDYRLTKNWFAAAELGADNITRQQDQLNFTTSGSFIKLGADYNIYENWMDREDMIYTGFRYGVAVFSQTLNSYTVFTRDSYFDKNPVNSNQYFDGLSAHWLELVAGIRTRVFNNVFVGFSIRLNRMIYQKQPENFENLFIPGFNKKYSGNIGVGMNYSITYFIPLYKSKKGAITIPEVEDTGIMGNTIEKPMEKPIENNMEEFKDDNTDAKFDEQANDTSGESIEIETDSENN